VIKNRRSVSPKNECNIRDDSRRGSLEGENLSVQGRPSLFGERKKVYIAEQKPEKQGSNRGKEGGWLEG